MNARDWLFVDDHVHGLIMTIQRGKIGKTYFTVGKNEN